VADAAASPQPHQRAAAIDFLREEVVEICGALALGGSMLRRLGLGAEASRLEALFGAVESRLAPAQPAEASEGPEDSEEAEASPSPSWS
jgi:hypothetical protein